MIYRKCGDAVCECDGCGEECTELFHSFSDPDVWVCEDCLKEDFDEAFENWKVDHLVDLDYEESKQDEQNAIDSEEQYRDMLEDD